MSSAPRTPPRESRSGPSSRPGAPGRSTRTPRATRPTKASGPLAGRTAVVTGAGQGVGRGIALALGAAGANVIVASRRPDNGQPVADEIVARGGRARCVPTDVTSRVAIEAAVAAAVESFGGLDIMVHNAFTDRARRPHRLEDVDDELWSAFSQTAVWASFWCAQAAFPALQRSGQGRLVLVTSPAGIEGSANVPIYAPVKAAQRGLAKSLAREWGSVAITVNCVAPVARTAALDTAFAANPDLEERVTARTALGRVGDPEVDIGGVVVWLAGDGAGYVTGQTIVCDGGSFLGL